MTRLKRLYRFVRSITTFGAYDQRRDYERAIAGEL
jgi:hypothetical protein